MDGEVIYLYCFDLPGSALDLAKLEMEFSREDAKKTEEKLKGTPEYITSPTSFIVNLPVSKVLYNEKPFKVNIRLNFFELGAFSIMIRVSYLQEELATLRRFNSPLFVYEGKKLTPRQIALEIFEKYQERVTPYLSENYELNVLPEEYKIFCIPPAGPRSVDFLEANRRNLSAILCNDDNPEQISEQEARDDIRYWYTYYQTDLVVIDWDAALIADKKGGYENILTVIELANLQLLELRTYDAYVKTFFEKAFDDISLLYSREGIFKSASNVMKEVLDLRLEIIAVNERITNITKFFGDWYLAKIYMGLRDRFHLESWRLNLEKKINTLNDLYQAASREAEGRKMLLLEALIVALFVLDVILLLEEVLK